jgi:hypothetical protein
MKVVIAYTGKPCDGLFYYSYEHCSHLNSLGIKTKLVIILYPQSKKEEYVNALKSKYIDYQNVEFDVYSPELNDIVLVMGRSMLTLGYEHIIFKKYNLEQTLSTKLLFTNKIINVFAENHPIRFPKALNYFKPKFKYDLCDYDVYPNGEGEPFKKIINFSIYKPFENNIKFKYLFNGVNEKYYDSFLNNIKLTSPKYLKFNELEVSKVPYFDGKKLNYIETSSINNFKSHGILVLRDILTRPFFKYGIKFKDDRYNNIEVPVKNILGMFDTYVYNKQIFDPAPRLMMECKYFKKKFLFLRDTKIIDGGSAYLKREPYCLTSDKNKDNINVLITALEKTHEKNIIG